MTAFDYTVTIRTDSVAVLCALRGLVHCSQKQGPVNTAWGGTGEKDWRAAKGEVTFRFSKPEYREAFLRDASDLLPARWSVVREHNG